ncbi:hypothetical protein WKK_05345 [Weissella koreensis KACC 15510]|uniref:hypothetical protein n=1 Tax=Weissella koreensis TaxID=165096 RepID=UPI000217504D|nr:hypothetical protein [Weissella koreensis]AEJ23940.1 hypothetical protein WKK_05345 [Weissella koreensis KACC 15510]
MKNIDNAEQILTALAIIDLIKIQNDIFANSDGKDINYDMKQIERLTMPMRLLSDHLTTQLERYPENIKPEY